MALIAVDHHPGSDYQIDVDTSPRPVIAGQPFRLRLTVRDPRTRKVQKDFAVVHEKRFHLFVISQDLEEYQHVHPQQEPDGTWALEITVPRPGQYKIYSDFLPSGGTPQLVVRPLATSDLDAGDAVPGHVRLVPDQSLRHVVGDLSVNLDLPPGGLVAGREEQFVYTLTDALTGALVRDVEPYLGAWGHSLAISEDMSHVVHAHPVETVPADRASARGGPRLTFKAALPHSGTYRIWTQIKRNGKISTAVFTVSVTGDPGQQRGSTGRSRHDHR